ncbi:MAG: hypothetical protein ABI472_06105 [Ginsengibacter sp.]
MTIHQVNSLISRGVFPDDAPGRKLIETHISWVILCDKFVYKIKKPVHYSFLNFSTIEKRKHFCKREIELNKRLAENVYVDVQPVREKQDRFIIGGKQGSIIDYAVRMNKLDGELQMDKLLQKNKITKSHIIKLAEKIAQFHKGTAVIHKKKLMDLQKDFNDLGKEQEYLANGLGSKYDEIISFAMATSDSFIQQNRTLLEARLNAGLFRDCHGDLHSRNIFLLPEPVPFDCIEFNDDFRRIDVLNEVAFLCMDLDAFGRHDLSDLFVDSYNCFFPTMMTREDRNLFIFYKCYRANVRAKVNSLRARSSKNDTEKSKALAEAKKYLHLMDEYVKLPGVFY